MADYVIVYDDVSGYVWAVFGKTSTDNVSTWKSDGYLEIDSVKVLTGLGSLDSQLEAIVLTDPTKADPDASCGVYEVDAPGAPTDMDERSDGARDPEWPYS
jgi:hypothetical protein